MNAKAIFMLVAMKFVLSEFVGRLVFAFLMSSGAMAFLATSVQTPVGTVNLYAVLLLGMDFLVNVSAGYLVALWAPDRQIKHGLILGLICLGFSFLTLPVASEVGLPWWSHFARYLVVPEILFGSWLLMRKQTTALEQKPSSDAPIASPFGD